MKRNIFYAALTSVLASQLLVAGAAEARRVRQPVAPGSNVDEFNLIGLTPDLVSSANGGSGVVVGLFDGLTQCSHPDLAGRCEYNLIPGGTYRYYDSHGTHTAGTIAGTKYGVAPLARIVNYGVFDDRTYVATGSKLIDAWNAAYGKGASIASMSFGCTQMALCFTASEVAAMANPNVKLLYVKAAGNDGLNLVNESIAVSQTTAAAALDRLILVGSTNVSGTISSFSNRPGETCLLSSGQGSCLEANKWKYHFLVAPGENIYAALPGGGYGYMSGTSMATPIVAGVAALLEARWPTLKSSPETVAEILFTSATDKGAAGVDAVYGWGLLNATKAFQASGSVTIQSAGAEAQMGVAEPIEASPMMARLGEALGPVTVYDRFGRDFSLAETRQLRMGFNYEAVHQLLGRRMLGLGGQAQWSGAFFAAKPQARGFMHFNSPAETATTAFTPDQSLRVGVDMPFKGGMAQVRLTGATGTRVDFAHDPSLAPLSFFASTGLLKSSFLGHALVNVADRSRLSLYATSTSPGSMHLYAPNTPLLLELADRSETAQLALKGTSTQQRQSGFGIGYWTQPDRHTVIGLNLSMLNQKNAFYDLVSTMPVFAKPSRMYNAGVAASRTMGSWEASVAGEVTHLRPSATSGIISLTPTNIVSAEMRLRKAGIGFAGGKLSDSLGIALVMPPRAVSGSLKVDYLTRTEDGLGRRAALRDFALSEIGADPVKVEAAYRLTSGSSWSLDVGGGVNLHRNAYSGAGEAFASFRMPL